MIKLANNLINLVLKQAAGPSGKQYVDSSWHPPQLDLMPNIIEPPPPGPVPTYWPELPKTTVTPLAAITRGYKGNVDVTQRSIASARQNQALHPELIDKHTPQYTEENLNRKIPVSRMWGYRDYDDGTISMRPSNATALPYPTRESELGPPSISNGGFTQTGHLATAPIFGDNEIHGWVPIYDGASRKSYLMPNAEIRPKMMHNAESPTEVTNALANMHPSVVGHHEVTHNLANKGWDRLAELPGVTKDRLESEGTSRRVERPLSQFNLMQLSSSPAGAPPAQHLSKTQEFPAGIAETKSRLYQDYSLDPVYDTPAKMDTYMENLSKLKDQYPDRYGQMYDYLQSLSPEARMATVGMIAQNTATKGPYGQQPVKMQA